MLRAYFVHDYDEPGGYAVIAESAKEAKKIAFGSGELPFSDFIDIRVRWIRQANIEGLEKGLVQNDLDALKRGMYDTIEGICEECKKDGLLYRINGKAVCLDCYDKIAMGAV